jgi:predicted RNA binding protein YcfA (HicA-like mRNA interferase family)
MPSKYPSLKASDVVRALRKLGFQFKSQTGSHAKYMRHDGIRKRTTIVPMHYKDFPKGTLQSVLVQAGISLETFLAAL